LSETWYEDEYKYFHYSNYHRKIEIPKDDWNSRHFASVDKNGNLLGYISYEIRRINNSICGVGAINFTNNKIVFGKDLVQVIDDIFFKFHHNKIEFSVVVGNPIEQTYDKLIYKYGGRIVGVRRRQAVLIDGLYYDDKLYEILNEDYIAARNH